MAVTDDELRYGWWKWRPSCFQWFNTAGWYTIFLCYLNGIYNFITDGLNGVVTSTIERRFGLSSSQSSLINSVNSFANIPMTILVSVVGAKGHRTLWVACGAFGISVGSILFAVPHFATGLYQPGGLTGNNLCRNRSNETICEAGSSSPSQLSGFLALFIIARLLMGVAGKPTNSMGLTFLDDVVRRDTFAIYSAFFISLGVIGPAIGYIGGGQMLNIYTDFHAVNPGRYGLTPRDPRWVGAWWLGFLIGGIALFLVVLPMGGFSRDIPGAQKIRDEKKSEAYRTPQDTKTEDDFGIKLRGLLESLKIMLINPPFLFLIFYAMVDFMLISGITSYGPKYIENQFSMSSGNAGMMFGIITLPAGTAGTIIGGYIIKKFNMTVKGLLRLSFVLNAIIIFLSFMFLIICKEVRFVGVNVGYENSTTVKNLTAPCNSDCYCADLQFSPICSADNKRYFSPCHAGCTYMQNSGSRKDYFNCSCISSITPSSGASASSSSCTVPSCKLAPLFLVMLFMGIFFTFACGSLGLSTVVRVVPNAQRSLAIGFNQILTGLLGGVFGPVIFGATFDSACTLWRERCNSRGSCLAYDNTRLGINMYFVAIGIKLTSLICVFIAWRSYKPPIDEAVSDADTNDKTKNVGSKVSIIKSYMSPAEEPNIKLQTVRPLPS